MPDVEVRIASGDRLEVRSPTLFSGYRRDPRSTADAFTVDGWLRTGDLGSLDEDGRLTVYGRADDAIRTGGETVWPEEVERALREHPKVADAAVRGVPDARWGEQVAAWVVPRTVDDPPTLEELREHCATTLARFKLPKELSLVAELPKTATGKVRRAELR
jgi:fatty-acyl-CoA synthase